MARLQTLLLLIALLLAVSAKAEGHRAPVGRILPAGIAASAVFLGSAVGGVAVASIPLSIQFSATGRPNPLVFSLSMASAIAITAVASHLLVPETLRLADDDGFFGDISAARAEGWRLSRWPLLAAGIANVSFTAGALLEQGGFGRGQLIMVSSVIAVLMAGIVYGVLEVWGMLRGYQRSRQPRPSAFLPLEVPCVG